MNKICKANLKQMKTAYQLLMAVEIAFQLNSDVKLNNMSKEITKSLIELMVETQKEIEKSK